jgi:pyruvate kinase
MERRTKIGITLGPASASSAILTHLLKEVDFVRLNFSHGTYEAHAAFIKQVSTLSLKTGCPVTILQDLQGAKIRLGSLPDEGIAITINQHVVLNTAISTYATDEIPLVLPGLEKSLHSREHILIDDGLVELIIEEIKGTRIITKVLAGKILKSHKGINLPDSDVSGIPALSEKDKADVRFGIEQAVDMIALSFVKHAGDVEELRSLIASLREELHTDNPYVRGKQTLWSTNPDHSPTKLQKKHFPLIIAKIERPEAVKNIKEILEVADGIMVARGDLGLEIPQEELPVVQKNLIRAAQAAGKSVMVATQLLSSMEHNLRPTRAEVNDIAGAVIDRVTALLLTNETAVGEHPLEAVDMLSKTIVATEKSSYDDIV